MYRLYSHLKYIKNDSRFIYRYAIFSLLFATANGIVAFTLPILLEKEIHSMFWVGAILASSSLWDIVADVGLGVARKIFSYIGLAISACIFMAGLFLGNLWLEHVSMLIFSMVLWGFYVEFYDFSIYKFIGNHTDPEHHGLHFGLLQQFKSVGYVIAPVIAGAAILTSTVLTLQTGLFFTVWCD